MELRKEVLIWSLEDGRIALYDPLLQYTHELNQEESQQFQSKQWSKELVARFHSSMLLEDMGAQIIRDNFWKNRLMSRILPAPDRFDEIDWNVAKELPALVQEHWRDPERWRRLFEHGLAGNEIFVLNNFVESAPLQEFVSNISTWKEFSSPVVTAQRALLHEGPVYQLMQNAVFRKLVSTLLKVPLREQVWLQAWGISKGECIKSHSDGTSYSGTCTVGCSSNWKAKDGGAISFGKNTQQGWESTFRWLPHLGDMLLFRPKADLWHAVEEVQQGHRLSITGWWIEGKNPHQHH